MNCQILAINGMPDHIHLLVKFSTTVSISKFNKQVKGTTSRFINSNSIGEDFRSQIGYGVFSASRWDLEKIIGYVKNQKEHHAEENLNVRLECSMN